MKIEINAKQAKMMWIYCNSAQHRAITSFKELAKDHASVKYAETEEDLKHVTAHWVNETRREYDELTDLKNKLMEVMFEKEKQKNE